MKFAYTLISLIFAFASFANPMDSVRSERRADGMYVIHQVEDQETIYSIARRYGGSVAGIIKVNGIVDSRIEIGQELAVKIEETQPVEIAVLKDKISGGGSTHFVEPGETLYGISKNYGVKVKELRKWNNLDGNAISPGMILKINGEANLEKSVKTDAVNVIAVEVDSAENDSITEVIDPYADFEKYLVQTGETLHTIAAKIGVKLDSLRTWNKLDGDFLRIGQELFFRKELATDPEKLNEPKKKVRTQIDEKGFERVFEEGILSTIEAMNTTRFLALHRNLPIGTDLEVRNLMNNQIVHVKVVGKLPETGQNKNILLRISKPAYEQLGILDSKSRVEVSYRKN